MHPTTESDSFYDHLEQRPVEELLTILNAEDRSVPLAVGKVLPEITAFVEALVPRMAAGGRLFYLGAGTSGRLGIVDASECPPTFGVSPDRVIGLIAGGDGAIRQAVEFAEDDLEGAWRDMQAHHPTSLDTVLGIAASGRTPYVIGGVRAAHAAGLLTACLTCNANAPLIAEAIHAIVPVVGPEVLTGSTRLKAGTAQKLVLNMISTATMIQLGHVRGNKMIDMQLSNDKLWERAVRFLQAELPVSSAEARDLLHQHGSVRAAIKAFWENTQA